MRRVLMRSHLESYLTELKFFRCLSCGGFVTKRSGNGVACDQCGKTYEVVHGVPILVRDWRSHEGELQQARNVQPDWYLDEQPGEDESPWRHHMKKRRRYVESALRRYLRDRGEGAYTGTLLDLGCGDGHNLTWLASYATDCYGSDYNLVRLVRARERNNGAIVFLADILDYPSQDGFFDVILFNHVIEHIDKDEEALKTVYRILKPGGLVILGTPNEGSWWWQLAYRRAPHLLASTDHVHFYTAETIAAKMSAQGFCIQDVTHLGWGPPDWEWDGRLRKYKLLDDIFEMLGRIFIPTQASSLYVLGIKPR